jgi:hypothetical protein
MDVAVFGETFFNYYQRAYHHAFEVNATGSFLKTMTNTSQKAVDAFCSVSFL